MRLPDGSILMHGTTPYDPRKAHEYYLKTRHLKGRKKGQSTYTVTLNSGKKEQLSAKQLAEEKTNVAQRVAHITQRLNDLKAELNKLMAAAHHKDAQAKKKPTAADKAKSARSSKQYRQKHHQQISNKNKQAATKKAPTPKHKKGAVEELQHKIEITKSKLV